MLNEDCAMNFDNKEAKVVVVSRVDATQTWKLQLSV